MKLHFHPVSTASRPVVLFLEESKIWWGWLPLQGKG